MKENNNIKDQVYIEPDVVNYAKISKNIIEIYKEAMIESGLFYKVFKKTVHEKIKFFCNDIEILFDKKDEKFPINYCINNEGHNHIVLDITADSDDLFIKNFYKNLIKNFKHDKNITINNLSNKLLNIYFHKKHDEFMPADVEEYLYAYDLLEKENSIHTRNKIKEKFKRSITDLYKNYLIKIHEIALERYKRSK